jgi:prepilin-type N-terminal cleavage/methylation domain-containing protein
MKNKKEGFTLIELIVSITIVAVITTLAMVNFGATNKKARDSRRASDLQKVAIALEMSRQVGGTYPTASGGLPTGLVAAGYLQVWPTDPKSYSYVYAAPTSYTYTLSAYMEDLGSTNMAPSGSCGTVTCNFRITNP